MIQSACISHFEKKRGNRSKHLLGKINSERIIERALAISTCTMSPSAIWYQAKSPCASRRSSRINKSACRITQVPGNELQKKVSRHFLVPVTEETTTHHRNISILKQPYGQVQYNNEMFDGRGGWSFSTPPTIVALTFLNPAVDALPGFCYILPSRLAGFVFVVILAADNNVWHVAAARPPEMLVETHFGISV